MNVTQKRKYEEITETHEPQEENAEDCSVKMKKIATESQDIVNITNDLSTPNTLNGLNTLRTLNSEESNEIKQSVREQETLCNLTDVDETCKLKRKYHDITETQNLKDVDNQEGVLKIKKTIGINLSLDSKENQENLDDPNYPYMSATNSSDIENASHENICNQSEGCVCDQETLRKSAHPSVLKVLKATDKLKHWNGYVVPAEAVEDKLPLAQKYPHPLDKHIVFWEREHLYFLKGVRIGISCTGFIHQYCRAFEADIIISKMIQNVEFPMAPKYKRYQILPMYRWMSVSDSSTPGIRTDSEANSPLNKDEWANLLKEYEKNGEEAYKIPFPTTLWQPWKLGMVLCENEEWVRHQIKRDWYFNRVQSSEDGTGLHLSCEYYANQLFDLPPVLDNKSPEFQFAVKFFKDMADQGWCPYRTEHVIYDEELDWAGSVDLQFQRIEDIGKAATAENRKDIFLFDHKRSKLIKLDDKYAMMKSPCKELSDCNYNHYLLQLNAYTLVLEKHYYVNVVGASLSVFHPVNSCYLKFPVPRRMDLVEAMFEERRQFLRFTKEGCVESVNSQH